MKANGLIALLSFIPIKYLELVYIVTSFEITTLSKLTSQIFIGYFFTAYNFSFAISLSLNLIIIILRTHISKCLLATSLIDYFSNFSRNIL